MKTSLKWQLAWVIILNICLNTSSMGQDSIKSPLNALYSQYDTFREPSITHRRFKHKDIVPLIQALPFEKSVAGQSFEGRDIYQIKLGIGTTKVLLWSQMHGDETTATMALFDIFKFFNSKNDGFDSLRSKILRGCSMTFVPMLNPDGAERFQRRTANEIDMNRDAIRLQTTEGVLLKRLQNTLQPEFAFNLHDQGARLSAGNSKYQATISFLATAYNRERSWNPVRTRSMQVICHMSDILKAFIPHNIAKYNDEFEPRAFGDNIQKWGSSLILIESGGYKEDREKQYIRKLNFVAILSALESIADKSYEKHKLSEYEAIPNNANYLYDLLIRNARFEEKGKIIIKDIGVNLSERNLDNATRFKLSGTVEDLGGLSTYWGIQEIDAKDMTVRFLKNDDALLKKYNLTNNQSNIKMLRKGDEATFMLEQNGTVKHVIIDGVLKE